MSSSPQAEPRNWSPQTWSLRARLLAGQVLLIVAVCAGVGATTEFALYRYLVDQLDNDLVDSAQRSAVISGRGPLPPLPIPFDNPPPPAPSPGPGPDFLDAPGQPVGLVAAVVRRGETEEAGVLTNGGERADVTDAAKTQLADLTGERYPATHHIDGLGSYRVMAISNRSGEMIVTGLPLAGVDATLVQVGVIFSAVAAVAILAATTAGVLVIRRALAPLTRVAATATEVAYLPLDRGEVELPVRVAERDANPRTEVGRLGAALNRMLDHIAAALSTRQASEMRVRQFVADASHELRTPLTAIRGYTELAQRARDDVPEGVAHAMGRVESEAGRMTHLVEDMLLLARLDSGRPLQQDPVDLSRLSVDAVSDAHVAGPDHNWSLDLPDEPVVVVGDAARLHQVLTNLLTNARVHTGPGTTVTLSLSAEGDRALLRIVDDGPGIPAHLQSEVFERFARGDSSRSRKAGGTGLGLAIVSAVVRAHRGTITLSSVAGRTEFTVLLPTPDGSTAQREGH